MKKTVGIIMLAIAGLLMLNVGLISADEHPTAIVSGTVTNGTDNVPIEDAVLMLEGSDPVLSTSTDENGNYVLTDVPVDEPSFTASVDGYDSETVGPVLIEDGAATVNFSLQPVDDPAVEPETATVSGTVTDGTDNVPIEDAVVKLEGSDPVLSTSTDENGNYVLTDVPVDEPSFTASVDGYDSETVGLVLIEDGAATVNFSLQPVTLQPVDGEDDEDEGGKVAGTRHGYVGIYTAAVTGAATSSTNLTTTTTGAATAGYFMVKTKQGMIKIHTPDEGSDSVTGGIESFTQTTGSKSQTPKDGDRVVYWLSSWTKATVSWSK